MASDSTGNAMREFDTGVRLDGQVLPVATGLTLLVGLGFGLLPALHGARRAQSRDQGSQPRRDRRSRLESNPGRSGVIGEIAVAVVLLVATGLMVKSFENLIREDWGFETSDRIAFNVTFSNRLRPAHPARVAYVEQALERLRSLPRVIRAIATAPDLVSFGRNLAGISPQGGTPPAARGYFLVNHRMVMPGYFKPRASPFFAAAASMKAIAPTDRRSR